MKPDQKGLHLSYTEIWILDFSHHPLMILEQWGIILSHLHLKLVMVVADKRLISEWREEEGECRKIFPGIWGIRVRGKLWKALGRCESPLK